MITLTERIYGLLVYKGVDFKEASYEDCPEGLWFYDLKELSKTLTDLILEHISENIVLSLKGEEVVNQDEIINLLKPM